MQKFDVFVWFCVEKNFLLYEMVCVCGGGEVGGGVGGGEEGWEGAGALFPAPLSLRPWLFILSCLCAVWYTNFLHWHVTFAKCSENLLSTVIVGYESVGNLNKIQAICQLLKNMKNHELK